MPNFAANLTMMFNEVDFVDRFAAAANFGFKGVEYLFPYDYEPAQLTEKLEQHGLAQVLHNLPAGDWAAGERGIACHPDRVGEFQEGVGKAIEYATALNCPQVNCLSGLAQDGVSDEDRDATIISNLKFAAEQLGAAGIKLLIEPINTIDIPGSCSTIRSRRATSSSAWVPITYSCSTTFIICRLCKAILPATSNATRISSDISR